MSVVAKLMEAAIADTDVLRALDAQGDRFIAFRDVDFLIRAPSPDQASIIRDFLNDHSFGDAELVAEEGGTGVRVVINMPVTQPVILCVSGFMTCVAELFGAEMDGWGCVDQGGT